MRYISFLYILTALSVPLNIVKPQYANNGKLPPREETYQIHDQEVNFNFCKIINQCKFLNYN